VAESAVIEVQCSVCHAVQSFRVKDAESGHVKALRYLERVAGWRVVNGEAICPAHMRNLLHRGMAFGFLISIGFWAVLGFAVFMVWRTANG
jgi:hypothetical protein